MEWYRNSVWWLAWWLSKIHLWIEPGATNLLISLSCRFLLYFVERWLGGHRIVRQERLQWLRKFIKLQNGVPSQGPISRVFRVIKPNAFHDAFLAWVKGLGFSNEGLNVIAIDGKSLRRSLDKKHGMNMLHSVAAWSTAN